MKIFALTVAGASSYFRLTQYRPLLEKAGLSFVDDIDQADCVIVQKQLLALSSEKLIRKRAKKLLFDFDDAIWTRPLKPYSWMTSWRVKRRLHFWLKQADIVTCSSSFLASYAAHFTKPAVLPMTVDTNLFQPKATHGPLTIGWAGAPHNLHHLERLEPVLKALGPSIHLRVFSGQKPKLSFPFTYQPFQEGGEAAFTQSLDIGLLPLTSEEFSLGKSPIKAVQYIACGLPVVGNVYGATKDILQSDFSFAVETAEEWLHALKTLASNKALRHSMGQKARAFALAHHSCDRVADRLINLLQG